MTELIRAEMAAAAEGIERITKIEPYPVQSNKAGHGWVTRGDTEWPNNLGSLTMWRVWVVLPQAEAEAEKWADELVPALAVALYNSAALMVRRVVLQNTVFDSGQTLPTLYVEGQRED